MGEGNTGKLDLGIFIASIVPDGPADKDGRIKPGTKPEQRHRHRCWLTCSLTEKKWNECFSFLNPGGRLISLNKISLEGVTFSDAAAILQNSPEEVELIVSQPNRKMLKKKS